MMSNEIKLVLFFTFCISFQCSAQKFGDKYEIRMKRADSLYKKGDYRGAGICYNTAFWENGNLGYVPDRLKAARAWSMAEEPDSAFYHLFRIIERTAYDDVNTVLSEPDFLNLKKDTRWEKAIDLIATNKRVKEAKYNWQLISTLDTVFADDQKYRLTVGDSINKYGIESPEFQKFNKMIIEIDSINLLKVAAILDSHGWPGPEVIKDHSTTIFLVLQHSDLSTQQKYLPVMEDAARRGSVDSASLALFIDRIAIGEGRCQIYGSQIGFDKKTNSHYVLPLADPANVDQRREKFGLGNIGEYVLFWKISWDLNGYKKKLKKILSRRQFRSYDCLKK